MLTSARDTHARLQTALAALQTLQQATRRLEETEAQAQASASQSKKAETLRVQARAERRRAQDEYRLAAKGVADLQKGIEELHRRAGAHRQATRQLAEAEHKLEIRPLRPTQFAAQLVTATTALERVDRERRTARTRLDDAAEHRLRHAQVLQALQRLVGRQVDAFEAHQEATEALHLHREQRLLADRLPELQRQLAQAREAAAHQMRARQLADELGIVSGDAPAAEIVAALLGDTEDERSALDQAEQVARRKLAEVQRRRGDLLEQHRQLSAREPRWRTLAACAAHLKECLGIDVETGADLQAAREQLAQRHSGAVNAEGKLLQDHDQIAREARELLVAGGTFSPALLELRDRLGAELLTASFDEVAVEEAAVLEARLGSLARALVVDDAKVAARLAAARGQDLPEVLLLSRHADLQHLSERVEHSADNASDVVVDEGIALRVSRVPAKPTLGRLARERRAASGERPNCRRRPK